MAEPSSNSKIINQLRQQMAVANVQEQLSKMTGKCFNTCVHKPGKALNTTEQRCIYQCMDRFMDAWNLMVRTYGNRVQREHEKQHDPEMLQ